MYSKEETMTWKFIARSAVGVSHIEQQIPCQDYTNYSLLNKGDVAIGAVADGAGMARHSDVGAKIVVETVLSALQDKSKFLTLAELRQYNQHQTRKLFEAVFHKAVGALKQEAQNQGCAFYDLACTIVAFLATPEWLGAMQIGDGFLITRLQEKDYHLLFQPDKGEFINETTFITSKSALEEMQVEVLSGKQEFICASTDGLERVAIRMRDWTPFPPFFRPLEEFIKQTENPEAEDQYLLDFLNSERLNARTNDDKTLLLGQFIRNSLLTLS
jgi:serine/threonine protein phosphatase PrpC